MTLIEKIKEYKNCAVYAEKKAIDASCCQTSRDWDKFHQAQETVEVCESELFAMVEKMENELKKYKIFHAQLKKFEETVG